MTATGQRVTVRTADGRHTLTGLLGANAPETVGGRGGWTEVARPRRPSIVEWTGPGLRTAAVEMILDGWVSGRSVAAQEAVADALAPVAPTSEPPTVLVTGAPGISPSAPWVVQAVSKTDRLLDTAGATARVTVTFDLLERRTADVLVVRPDAAKRSATRNGTGTAKKARVVTVKAGQTLASIAARELGKASRWREIATLNGLRSSTAIRAGQKLKLP